MGSSDGACALIHSGRLCRHQAVCGHNVALPPNNFRFSRCETDKRIRSPNIEAAFWKEKEACPIKNNTSPGSLETCFIYRVPYLLLLLSSWYCPPTRMSANTTNFNSLRHSLLRQIFYNLYLLWMAAILPSSKKESQHPFSSYVLPKDVLLFSIERKEMGGGGIFQTVMWYFTS
jgi:hypothetical protein